MPTTVHEKHYIKNQKKLNLIFITSSLVIMVFFYLIYKLNTNSTVTIYLVIAALCSIPAAQFILRYSLFFGQKDCNSEIVDELYKLPSTCYIINSALFTNTKGTAFIDHIIISGNNVICLLDHSKKNSDSAISALKTILNTNYDKYNIEIISVKDYKKETLATYILPEITEHTELLFMTIKTHLI